MAEQIPGLLENSQKQDLGENDCPLNVFILSPSSPLPPPQTARRGFLYSLSLILPPPQIARGSFSYTVILYSLKKKTFNFFSCFQKKQAAQKAEHSRKREMVTPLPRQLQTEQLPSLLSVRPHFRSNSERCRYRSCPFETTGNRHRVFARL